MKAYDTFICKLCEMARNQKRINATEKPTNNEKYAFRCFSCGSALSVRNTRPLEKSC